LDNNAIGFATTSDALAEYLEVTANAALTHQEHDTITLPPGKYKSVTQAEYSPEAIKAVTD
jgi:hypothetical protein